MVIGSFQFRRAYNSSPLSLLDSAPVEGSIGDFWRHNFQRYVVPTTSDPVTAVTVIRNNGREFGFYRVSGLWVSDEDVLEKLEELIDGQGVTTGWRYIGLDNTTELYDANGVLQSITNLQGNTQTLSYDASNRLARIDSNIGGSLVFAYDSNNRITSVTDHFGRVWDYRYGANSNLEFVDNPDSTAKRYHYEDTNAPNALTGITDERGIRYATYGYDSSGRAILSTHAGDAQRVDIVYSDTDGTRTVTNSLGRPSTYTTAIQLGVALVTDISGPGCSTCGNGDTNYNYDPTNNNLLRKTENGFTTEYGNYDNKGQYGYRIEAQGTPEVRRTDYTYDSRFFNKITTLTEPSVFPGNSKVTTNTYDAFGNRLSETINGFDSTGTPVSRTTTRQYTGPLNQLSFIDGLRIDVNDFTYYRYYPNDTSQPIGTRVCLKEIEDANSVLIRSNI